MRRMLWVLKKNPVYAEKHNGYPELRFYAETILALASAGGFDAVDLVYLDERPGTLQDRTRTGDLEWMLRIRDRFRRTPTIALRLLHQSEVGQWRYDLGVMSIIAHVNPRWLKSALDDCAELASYCDAVIYGDSDLELDLGQTITSDAATMLRALAKSDHPLRRKLKATFITEYPEGYKARSQAALGVPAIYLPRLSVPIELPGTDPLIRTQDEVNRVYDLTFLKYYRGWWDRWLRDFYAVRPDTLTRYFVSPHPASYQADADAIAQDLGDHASVKRARMWHRDALRQIYRETKFVPAAGRPINRLTSKLNEGLAAGSCVLVPFLRYDAEDAYYQEVFDTYQACYPAIDYAQNWPRLNAWDPYMSDWSLFRDLRMAQTWFHNDLCGITPNADRVKHLLDVALN